MKTLGKVAMVSQAEMRALVSSAQAKDPTLRYEEWKKTWDQIQSYLKTVGTVYSCMTEEGDFIVCSDWHGDRCVDLNFLSMRMLDKSILRGLFTLISEFDDDWSLNIAGEHCSTPIYFDILISRRAVSVSINEALTEAEDPETRPWLRLLGKLCA